MNKILVAAIGTALAATTAHGRPPEFGIALQPLASIGTASVGSTGAEIVAYDARTRRAFAINSTDNDLVVLDLADPRAPVLLDKVSLDAHGAGLNSVDAHAGLVAVAVEASPRTDPGKVVFLDAATLVVQGAVTVGALPDMLTFDDEGQRVLVANEGEPNSYGQPDSVNPEGSISLIDLTQGVANAAVRTADFQAFSKEALLVEGVRVFGPGATAAQDLEPEYITLEGRTAWVTLQEANALAIVDIPTATVLDIVPLGHKDHMTSGQGLDASDRDGRINIANWPVFGLYQPDAVATFKVGNASYLVTANEGDSRSRDDFVGIDEEVRLGHSSYALDPTAFPDAATLKGNAALGRLNVSRASGDLDGDGDYDRIDVFGARSFSIWTTDGELVWDSGDALEQFFAEPANGYAAVFNASNNDLDFDSRSDNKGPEPEGIVVGKVAGRSFAFVGLERFGGVMVYDVSDPRAPEFATYANTRSFAEVQGGDRGAEGVEFVPADASPNGRPLVLVGNEVSRTVTIFQVDTVDR
jgi:hypothetical protein